MPPPQEWIISRVCEEFGCLPDAARRAMEQDSGGSIFQIMDYRSLANAKTRLDSADAKNTPTDKSATRYLQLQMELVGKQLGIDTSGTR